MSTIKEIAQRAKVSIATVSNVITGAVRVSPALSERVKKAIEELDYHPNYVARSLKTRQTRLLGMIISDITNPFFPQLVRGAEDEALRHNYLLITFNTDDRVERERRVLSVLRSRRVDGVLLVVAPSTSEATHLKNTLRAGVPVVCLDRIPAGVEVDSVTVDNDGGARKCVDHLLALGHRRIAVIAGPQTLPNAVERLQGYREALCRAGLPFDPGLVFEGDFRVESGYEQGQRLLGENHRPSAVFVCNDMMAMGLLRAAEELGIRCPRDLAVAIFDDLPFGFAFRPHLTAVSQPAYEVGRKGVELLLRRIEGLETTKQRIRICLETQLNLRESTLGFKFPESP
jgi:LacI family transcriptional regulator